MCDFAIARLIAICVFAGTHTRKRILVFASTFYSVGKVLGKLWIRNSKFGERCSVRVEFGILNPEFRSSVLIASDW